MELMFHLKILQEMENKNVLLNRLPITLVIMMITFCLSTTCMAQYLINQTSITTPTFRVSKQACTQHFNNGTVFKGTKETNYCNGNPVSTYLYGTFYYSNGDKLVSPGGVNGFDANFNLLRDGRYYYIRKNGELIMQEYRGGQKTAEYKMDANYYIKDHCIYFSENTTVVENVGGGYTGGSGYNSGNSSTTSTKRDVRATCGGCQGSGKCSHCHGKGINKNGYKCVMCHGRGYCSTCGGVGKKYVGM